MKCQLTWPKGRVINKTKYFPAWSPHDFHIAALYIQT